MKKHFKEENHALKKEIVKEILLLIVLFFQTHIAQVPINGFCKLNSFNIKSNYSKIFPVDFNNDGFKDIIILNPAENKYLSLLAKGKSDYQISQERYSNISMLANANSISYAKKVIGASSKSKEAGIISISKNGSLSYSSKLRFDGYPSFIDANVNQSRNLEMLVSGSGVEGINILAERGGKLKQSEIIKGKIFTNSFFIDLDYDSYYDIAAYDLSTNSIVFFYNNRFGDYEEARSVRVGYNATNINLVDFNSDLFTDIIYLTGGKLEVILGDSVSSFQKRIVFSSNDGISSYTVQDFNGDGFNDVAYINESKNELKISFGKGDNLFYKPIVYLNGKNLVDVASFVDRAGRKLTALSGDGIFYLINEVSLNEVDFGLALAIQPIAFQSFDYLNDGYKDFAFVDENDHNLKILLSERRRLFRSLNVVPLETTANFLLVDDTRKDKKTFICFEKNKNTIELINYDFETGNYKRNVVYTKEPIKEIRYFSDRLKNWLYFYVLTGKNKNLYLESFELRDSQIRNFKKNEIAKNVDNSVLSLSVFKNIYTLVKNKSNIDVVQTIFENKIKNVISRLTFQLQKDLQISSAFVTISELFNRTRPVLFLLSVNKKAVLYVFTDKINFRIPLKTKIESFEYVNYTIEDDDKIFVVFYNKENGEVIRIKINNNFLYNGEDTLFKLKGIKYCTASKFDVRNNYLIFVKENILTFKKFQ